MDSLERRVAIRLWGVVRLETERSRLGHRQVLGEVLWLLGFVCYFVGLGVFYLIFRPDDPSTGELIAAGSYVVLGASGLCWLRTTISNCRNPPYLELSGQSLVVVDPSSLEAPLHLTSEQIRLVNFDHQPAIEKRNETRRRFPTPPWSPAGKPNATSTWLYSSKPEEDLGLYAVGSTDEVPNVAILLTEPILLVPSNRLKWFFYNPRLAAKRWIRGLIVRVRDIDAMQAAVDGLGLLRDVTAGDLASLQPSPEESHHSKLLGRVQLTWVIVTLVVWAGSAVLYVLGGE